MSDRLLRFFKRVFRVIAWSLLLISVFGGGIFLYFFAGALKHRIITFPREARAWEALRAQRQPVTLEDGWMDYRGVCHTHSMLSHDSRMPWHDILQAAKIAGVDFLCMSDHPVDGKADFSTQWKGMHGGVLFIRGFELSNGLLIWGLPDDTVINVGQPLNKTAHEVHEKGGLVFFAHTEQERPWDLPELNGMEIYNIHTDLLDEDWGKLLPDLLLNMPAYGDQTLRLIHDRHPKILAQWDAMNEQRRITGIAASDAHRNIGIHGVYTWQDTLLINENSGNPLREWRLNRLTRFLLRTLFGPLDNGKELFRITKDPYERSLRYVNTHVLAHSLDQESILAGLRKGRAYVAFDMLADARGFKFFADAAGRKAAMGETMSLAAKPVLRAAAPLAGRFNLIRNGTLLERRTGNAMDFPLKEPGMYRVEVEIEILGAWIPWIYANPIRVIN